MDNGQLIIDNDCVAYGHYLNHFPKENTIIIHYTLSIINSFIGTINWNLSKFGDEYGIGRIRLLGEALQIIQEHPA